MNYLVQAFSCLSFSVGQAIVLKTTYNKILKSDINVHLLFFVMCQVSRLQSQTYRHLDSVGHYNTKLLKAQNIDSHIISYAYFF